MEQTKDYKKIFEDLGLDINKTIHVFGTHHFEEEDQENDVLVLVQGDSKEVTLNAALCLIDTLLGEERQDPLDTEIYVKLLKKIGTMLCNDGWPGRKNKLQVVQDFIDEYMQWNQNEEKA